mgnify:FL=1|tara:strand:- start:2364 stop:2603 length:240 start_codon:yes stop_codon:yes gene_type:complete
MARVKQSQNIDSMIQSIETVIENRCSLSDKDLLILREALNLLKSLKKKKGKTNEQILQIVVDVVVLLSKFFKDSDEMPQ